MVHYQMPKNISLTSLVLHKISFRLSRHKKVCQLIIKNPNDEYLNNFNTVIAENSELRNLLIKQHKSSN